MRNSRFKCRELNLYAPVLMALLCKEKNIHLTYIGTGCIFQYDEEHEIGSERKTFYRRRLYHFPDRVIQ